MKRTPPTLLIIPLLVSCGDDQASGPPPCGSLQYNFRALIPGPGEDGFDAALDRKARRIDRGFHAINAHATGINADVTVRLDDQAGRAAIDEFLDGDATELPAVEDYVATWEKSAGLYAGVGIAADAWRYGTLRDQGAACAEIDVAREQLLLGLERMHLATVITGRPGVFARSIARRDLPGNGASAELVPLFDESGAPLPVEKNNGTWRADRSGGFPEWVWEDSTSRDMLVGWALAFGAAWEVIASDDTISEDVKRVLGEDARALAAELRVVRPSGFDLEIIDADGRTTFHGYLNENAFDRAYIPGVENGFHAVMALGIVAALAGPAQDPELDRYLNDELIGQRKLHTLAREDMLVVNLGLEANFSNYNMAFTGALAALKYVEHAGALAELRIALRDQLYDAPRSERQPAEMKQSFFDFIWVLGTLPTKGFDEAARTRGLETLAEYADAPFYDVARASCDEAEIAAERCTLEDGTVVDLLGMEGRGDKLIARQPIPMRARPPSNYFWRSNPYEPNGGGDGSRLIPAVDFRVAFWLGRWTRI